MAVEWEESVKFSRTWLSIGACLVLLGCSTYSDIKGQSVDRLYDVPGVHSEELSACFQEFLRERHRGIEIHRNFDPRNDIWIIAVELETAFVGGGTDYYPYSLSFLDNSRGATIELRSLKTVWGGLQAPEDDIDEFISECSAAILRK